MQVTLVMFREDGEQKAFSLTPGQNVIGRRDDCDLRIPLKEISRKHAVVNIAGQTVTIRDLGSANGTYLNNQKVTEQDLSPGDHIVVGPVVFTVQIDGQPPDVRPVKMRLEARQTVIHPGAAAAASPGQKADLDVDTEGDEDPISALEAMASSDETAQIEFDEGDFDLSDSDFDMGEPKP